MSQRFTLVVYLLVVAIFAGLWALGIWATTERLGAVQREIGGELRALSAAERCLVSRAQAPALAPACPTEGGR